MPKLSDLFDGRGNWDKPFSTPEVEANRDVMGKNVGLGQNPMSVTSVNGYRVEYLDKEGDLIFHFFLSNKKKKSWPDNFINILVANIESGGDLCECSYIMELDSWWVGIKDFSVRRFGVSADASFVSSILKNL